MKADYSTLKDLINKWFEGEITDKRFAEKVAALFKEKTPETSLKLEDG